MCCLHGREQLHSYIICFPPMKDSFESLHLFWARVDRSFIIQVKCCPDLLGIGWSHEKNVFQSNIKKIFPPYVNIHHFWFGQDDNQKEKMGRENILRFHTNLHSILQYMHIVIERDVRSHSLLFHEHIIVIIIAFLARSESV